MTTETKTRQPLTDKQARVLAWIEQNAALYSPTVREIAAAFGIKSTNGVSCHLIALERKGYLKRNRNARGIQVLR